MSWARAAFAIALSCVAACDGGSPLGEGRCLSARDCGDEEACVSGACVPLGSMGTCAQDEECAAGQYCDQGACKDREAPPPGADASALADAAAPAEDASVAPSPDAGAVSPDAESPDAEHPDAAPPPPCASDTSCGAPAAICEAGACTPGCGQVGGLSCAMGTVCNNGTGRCEAVAGPCMDDGDCAAPRTVCETGQCVPGCGQTGGLQCGANSTCNAGTGRCDATPPPPCASDAACGAPAQICEQGACVAGCASAGCMGGLMCDAMTGRCVQPPSCAIDMFEDNDAAASPTLGLASGQNYPSLTACAMDDDFYAFDLGVGDRVQAQIAFTHADGDIDVQILTPSGGVGASSSGILDGEDASYTVTAAGRHLVRVYLYRDQGANPGNAYSARFTITPAPPPPMCASDRLEENDAQAAARALAVPATENGLTSCAMDDDYYAISALAGDELTLRATFTSGEGDIDLGLLGATGGILASSSGVTGTEQIVWTSMEAQTVALRVFLYGDSGSTPGNGYDLSVSARAVCAPDALEDNDSQSAQRSITAGTVRGLSACDQDDDYYRVTLAANQTLTVDLRFAHAEGDVDLYVLDSGGTIEESSVSVDDDELLSFTPSSAGNYTIRVRLYADLGARPGNYYTMIVGY